MVKTFEGPRDIINSLGLGSERDFFKEMRPVSSSSSLKLFDRCFMTESKSSHPNVLQIVGISDESSKINFIEFSGSK